MLMSLPVVCGVAGKLPDPHAQRIFFPWHADAVSGGVVVLKGPFPKPPACLFFLWHTDVPAMGVVLQGKLPDLPASAQFHSMVC